MNGLQISIIILAISLGALNFFLCASIMGGVTQDRRTVEKRLKRMNSNGGAIAKSFKDKQARRRGSILKKAMSAGGISSMAQSKKFMDRVFNELILADIMMKPEEFSLIWLLLTFVPSGLAGLFGAGVMPAATLAAVGAAAPIIYIRIKKNKRVKIFESQLGDTLIMMCNSLRSGFSFQQAMESVASDMPAPIGVEFGRVCNEIKFGATLEDALNNMTTRVKSPDLILVVSAVCIQRTTGGNLSLILSTISETIKDRLRIKGEISSITAQGRTSGMIIGALPIFIATFLMITNPDYMSMFFTTPVGNIMIIVAVVMEILGFFAIRKVTTIEY